MISYLRHLKIIRTEPVTCLTIQNSIPYLVERLEQKSDIQKHFESQPQTESGVRLPDSLSS